MGENPLGFNKEIIKKLRLYEKLLINWQKKFNLVSNNSMCDLWNRHIIDSAQLLSLLPKEKKNKITYDIGSGAGLPGIVLAILGRKDIVLCESNTKKCLFLKEVSRNLQLDVIVDNIRAESLPKRSGCVVLARAVAPLEKLISISLPLLEVGGIAIFPKGKSWNKELRLAQRTFLLEFDLVKSITSELSYIFVIKKAEKKIG